MAPECLVTSAECIPIRPRLWSAIIPELVAVVHVRTAMILRVTTSAFDAVMKCVPLKIARKAARRRVPSARPLCVTIPRRRRSLCKQRCWCGKQTGGNNNCGNSCSDRHGVTPFSSTRTEEHHLGRRVAAITLPLRKSAADSIAPTRPCTRLPSPSAPSLGSETPCRTAACSSQSH